MPDASAPAAPVAAPRRGLPLLPIVAGVLVVASAAFALARLTAPGRTHAPLRKFLVEPDTSGAQPAFVALSPDGRTVASLLGGRVSLRDLTAFATRSFEVDANAQGLYWSPDSRALVYLSGTKVVRLSVAEGQRQVLSDTRAEFSGGSGAWWTSRGTILFSRGDADGILEVSERGGDPRILVPADTAQETDLHEPCELPGGRGVLFVNHMRHGGISRVWVWSKGKRKLLLDMKDQQVAMPGYSPSGHLVFSRTPNNPGIWAVPFSLDRLEVTGEPFLVAADGTQPSVSADGTLCFRASGGARTAEMGWLDLNGTFTPVGRPTVRPSYHVAVDPTGPRAVRAEYETAAFDLWVYDFARSTRSRITFAPGNEDLADWSPDGRWLTHVGVNANCAGSECWHILRTSADGKGRPDTLAHAGALPVFTPDGRSVMYVGLRDAAQYWDLMLVPADGSRPPELVMRGNPRLHAGRISPDGTLMAYVSNETESYEVYLTRYPSLEGRWQVSNAGGQWPQWSPKGDKLYFSRGDEILQVSVSGGADPTLGNPTHVVTRPHIGGFLFGFDAGFAMSPDGRRVFTLRSPDVGRQVAKVAIVQNWALEFQDKPGK